MARHATYDEEPGGNEGGVARCWRQRATQRWRGRSREGACGMSGGVASKKYAEIERVTGTPGTARARRQGAREVLTSMLPASSSTTAERCFAGLPAAARCASAESSSVAEERPSEPNAEMAQTLALRQPPRREYSRHRRCLFQASQSSRLPPAECHGSGTAERQQFTSRLPGAVRTGEEPFNIDTASYAGRRRYRPVVSKKTNRSREGMRRTNNIWQQVRKRAVP
jgi:hypothetical protein